MSLMTSPASRLGGAGLFYLGSGKESILYKTIHTNCYEPLSFILSSLIVPRFEVSSLHMDGRSCTPNLASVLDEEPPQQPLPQIYRRKPVHRSDAYAPLPRYNDLDRQQYVLASPTHTGGSSSMGRAGHSL